MPRTNLYGEKEFLRVSRTTERVIEGRDDDKNGTGWIEDKKRTHEQLQAMYHRTTMCINLNQAVDYFFSLHNEC